MFSQAKLIAAAAIALVLIVLAGAAYYYKSSRDLTEVKLDNAAVQVQAEKKQVETANKVVAEIKTHVQRTAKITEDTQKIDQAINSVPAAPGPPIAPEQKKEVDYEKYIGIANAVFARFNSGLQPSAGPTGK
ncbi:MAG: hypothetical protein ABFD62_00560 [Syntrophaceae bacterium]